MARFPPLVFLAFPLSICCSARSAQEERSEKLESRQLESNGLPSINNFLSRAYHSAIVLNDYLYIDGGEISFYDDGELAHLPVNDTFSINLSSSWTNRTVTFNQIAKTAPVLNYVSLWADFTNSSFYAWGGEVSGALPPEQLPPVPENSVWKFTPANGGSGSWSEQAMSSNSIFPSLTRPAGAIGGYGNGTGYLMGGYSSRGTTPQTADVDGFVPIPGIVSYDIEAGTWKNLSATGYSTYGTAMYGQMQYVPFGAEGLLIVMGGSTSDAVEWTDRGSNYVSFETIIIFDTATNSWHNQTASGTIPDSRSRFCSVAASGDNGTYEIFIYGGYVASASGEPQASNTAAQRLRNIALDEVFVLSLPGFVWTKANYTAATPRVNHACNVAGGRQMIVTGGLNPASANGSDLISRPDVWTQGIGVFDMTAMQWKDNYDADAQPYVTPAAVKSWYAANGDPYPAEWDDAAVEGIFTKSASSGGSGSSNNSGATSSSNEADSSRSDTGAIVGGVVGSIAGLALVGVLVWFLMRRRRRTSNPPAVPLQSAEHEDTEWKAELQSATPPGSRAELRGPTLPPGYLTSSKPLAELAQPQTTATGVRRDPPRQELP